MSIEAKCDVCGSQLDCTFSIDNDGDGDVTVERCDCHDDNVGENAVNDFRVTDMWDEVAEFIAENPDEFITNYLPDEFKEKVEELREEISRDLISNIVRKYSMIPLEEE